MSRKAGRAIRLLQLICRRSQRLPPLNTHEERDTCSVLRFIALRDCLHTRHLLPNMNTRTPQQGTNDEPGELVTGTGQWMEDASTETGGG